MTDLLGVDDDARFAMRLVFGSFRVVTPSRSVVGADVRRGRRALIRRRVRGTLAATGLAAVAATFVTPLLRAVDDPARPDERPVALVAYHGAQPGQLAVSAAPATAAASVGPQSIRWGTGETVLSVMLLPAASGPPSAIGRIPIAMIGRSSAIYPVLDHEAATRTFIVQTASGEWVTIVAGRGLHWSIAQLTLFAAGLHIVATPPPSTVSSAPR